MKAFLRGFGSVLNIAGSPALNQPATSEEAADRDRAAIASDWAAIGRDMRAAFEQLSREAGESTRQQ